MKEMDLGKCCSMLAENTDFKVEQSWFQFLARGLPVRSQASYLIYLNLIFLMFKDDYQLISYFL